MSDVLMLLMLISEIWVVCHNTQIFSYFLQDGEGKEVNYAALNFSTRKEKRRKKKRESPQESVYSDVRAHYHNQQHPSL